eukprot:UN29139
MPLYRFRRVIQTIEQDSQDCGNEDEFYYDGYCYPRDYGSHCSDWDAETDLCKVTPPANYCPEPWCYVDNALCEQNDETTNLSVFFKDFELFYSYNTCNGTDYFTGGYAWRTCDKNIPDIADDLKGLLEDFAQPQNMEDISVLMYTMKERIDTT